MLLIQGQVGSQGKRWVLVLLWHPGRGVTGAPRLSTAWPHPASSRNPSRPFLGLRPQLRVTA